MSRLNKTEQIIELAMMFQNSYCGLSIEDIKNHFECSRRSAERMKKVLFELFADKIEEVESTDTKKHWRFIKGTMNALITFDANDFANLEYLKELITNKNKQKEVGELIEKIKALTPQKNVTSLNNDISAILETEGFAVRQYSTATVNSKFLEDLRTALLAYKKIKFTYSKNGDVFEVKINPYGVVILDKYYLIGFNENYAQIRTYRIDKIKSLTVIEEYFDKDENFNLQTYCNKSFGIFQEKQMNVHLEFEKSIAEDVLNYHFHPSQKIKELENGNIEVKFKACGTKCICHELFKWQDNVQIKAPTKLKTFYKDYLKRIYEKL